ncbi:MAG: RNA polymerase sigma-54 factor [Flavobacteriales bacterium]|nr:RNA polymerase sigma-54 factor [Flavobacteriales bacterium]|tara:strand:+ start:6717 stop:8171 length:1455 start_codon:yes stop_codon:yes gene_type:complete
MVKQSLEQSLQQKLSPQQIQLMKLIELSTLELEQKVKDEIETNPALDNDTLSSETIENNDVSNFDESDIKSENERDFDIDQYISDDEIPSYKLYTNNSSDEDKNESIPIVGGHTHFDMLKEQLSEVKLDEKEKIIAEYIIGCIDEDGYIRRSTDEIIDDLVFKENLICDNKEIQHILSIVQKFDPPGIGAHDLQECLLLQLNRKEQTEDIIFASNIIKNSFKQFVNKHYQKICDKFQINSDRLKKSILEIEKLNPKPASNTNQTKYTEQIIPDFTISIHDDKIDFSLNSRNAPSLNISKDYANMLNLYKETGGEVNKETKQAILFVKQKIDTARWFINAIQKRQQTLISTMTSIINLQKKYFLSGDEKDISPMILKDVADQINMDISTISRVVNSKYVETPYGIKSLRYYFSESMSKVDGESVSVKQIKSIIKDKISQEASNLPLNDQALVDYLNNQGYQIARRTVAKYREQMNIPVARLRKKL